MVKRITDLVKELDIAVQTLSHYPEQTSSFKMEVGIEDCLHIEFEYNKSRFVRRLLRFILKYYPYFISTSTINDIPFCMWVLQC